MNDIGQMLTLVIGGILALALAAVFVGKNAQTTQVIQAGGSALSGVIQAAVGPVL